MARTVKQGELVLQLLRDFHPLAPECPQVSSGSRDLLRESGCPFTAGKWMSLDTDRYRTIRRVYFARGKSMPPFYFAINTQGFWGVECDQLLPGTA